VLGEPNQFVRQQLQRPTSAPAGGPEQAVATSKASSLPDSLRMRLDPNPVVCGSISENQVDRD
jgi:hypothetical protein